MKRMIYCMSILLPVLMYQSIDSQPASAHSTGYRVLEGEKSVTAEFFYSDNELMRYSEALVFSPGDNKVEYQNGRTDQMGRFAFSPQALATWRIEVNDGVGHAVHTTLKVELQGADEHGLKITPTDRKAPFGDSSGFSRIVVGLSLILNLCLGMYVWKRRDVARRSQNPEL
ncbi:MAG TPA: hypothetical protein ENL37_03640, partial [Desulfobacteraceae bacterium]|nr:hypothetical protein [Desulfobacteraceae bacterium]